MLGPPACLPWFHAGCQLGVDGITASTAGIRLAVVNTARIVTIVVVARLLVRLLVVIDDVDVVTVVGVVVDIDIVFVVCN